MAGRTGWPDSVLALGESVINFEVRKRIYICVDEQWMYGRIEWNNRLYSTIRFIQIQYVVYNNLWLFQINSKLWVLLLTVWKSRYDWPLNAGWALFILELRGIQMSADAICKGQLIRNPKGHLVGWCNMQRSSSKMMQFGSAFIVVT